MLEVSEFVGVIILYLFDPTYLLSMTTYRQEITPVEHKSLLRRVIRVRCVATSIASACQFPHMLVRLDIDIPN